MPSDAHRDYQANPGSFSNDAFCATLSLYTPDGFGRHITLQPGRRVPMIGHQSPEIPESPNYISCSVMCRRHAEVWMCDRKFFIKDLGSRNGTFVNGERLSMAEMESEAYELQSGDMLDLGSDLWTTTVEGVPSYQARFSASVMCTVENTTANKHYQTPASIAAAEAMSNIKAWVKESDELSTLCWFTHPNDYERSVVATQVATYCEELGILSPRLFLSRRQDVRGWNLAYLLVCQLCHFIPGLQPLHVDPQIMHRLPFENLKEDWIREFFITPLIDQTSFPMVIIIDSLDMSKLELLRPLTILAMMLKDTPALPVRLLLTTHPDIRTQTVVGPHMAINRFLKEVHVVCPLHKLLDLVHSQVNIKKGFFCYIQRINWDEQPAYSRLVLGPLEANEKFQTPTPNVRPLVLLMQTLHLQRHFNSILEELGTIFDLNTAPELWAVLEKDNIEDQKLYIAILREVLRSNADAPQELSDTEAQLFVDFTQQLVDSGVLLKTSGHDFDRRVRRLILKVAKASDTLPASMFLQEGVRLMDPEPYAGGGYSDIYRATYNGQNVALKRLRVYRNNPDRERTNRRFCREALTWRPLNHPHVLPFLGIDSRTFPSYLCMVSPWMKNGTLPEVRKIHGPRHIDIDTRIFEVAQGLEYLHFENIVHGDLRGANILVDDDMHIRLSDFGLTVFSDASVDTQTDNAGCIRWMAPELFISEDEQEILQKTYETDVYAFACVYYELYRGLRPFDELPLDATVIHSVSRGFRPDRPLDEGDSIKIPEPVWEYLVQQCWHQSHLDRPTMQRVVGMMKSQRF